MDQKIQQMSAVASGLLNGVLITAGKPDVAFKRMIKLDGSQDDDLLVLGSAHRDFDDGYCIAVLNPDDALVGQLAPGVAYSKPLLKELVRGHCEAMVQVNCIGRSASLIATYRARVRLTC